MKNKSNPSKNLSQRPAFLFTLAFLFTVTTCNVILSGSGSSDIKTKEKYPAILPGVGESTRLRANFLRKNPKLAEKISRVHSQTERHLVQSKN